MCQEGLLNTPSLVVSGIDYYGDQWVEILSAEVDTDDPACSTSS